MELKRRVWERRRGGYGRGGEEGMGEEERRRGGYGRGGEEGMGEEERRGWERVGEEEI